MAIPQYCSSVWSPHHKYTHTRLTALFPGTTRVSRYWILPKQDSEWQWHQLAIYKSASRSRQITMPVPHHSRFFTGRMPFLPPNQQRQSTEGNSTNIHRISRKTWQITSAYLDCFQTSFSDRFPQKLSTCCGGHFHLTLTYLNYLVKFVNFN